MSIFILLFLLTWPLIGILSTIILQWIPPRGIVDEHDVNIGMSLGWLGLVIVLVYAFGSGIRFLFTWNWILSPITNFVKFFGPRQ
jgi:hypothetical protein